MMNKTKIICITPVFNDWESFEILVKQLKKIQDSNSFKIKILAINDGSTDVYIKDNPEFGLDLQIVNLKINIGHQRAIGVGLQYVFNEENDYDYVVVMDSDGEDKPEHIVELLNIL
ncbi:MAG: glycosyltransferase [Flavobacteriaceae bacterium]|nr:glycosyltransferase [Flavobacteriaceae bacterium]